MVELLTAVFDQIKDNQSRAYDITYHEYCPMQLVTLHGGTASKAQKQIHGRTGYG